MFRRIAAEGLGSLLLAATVIGSGIMGCCAGAVLAHAMFSLPLIQFSQHARTGLAQWLAEFVATFALVALPVTRFLFK